ncbi:MAG: T9SS type A sorting domain-containing protein [Aureispira sp.]|nr:T9SS type A sorting domain-containing protein [Aureispira sp.]
MKKIKFLIFSFSMLFMALFSNGQHQCGTTLEDQALMKEAMMYNRKHITASQIAAYKNSRATTYIPLSIHNVADLSGNGHAPKKDIYQMVCDLNGHYANQDVQFFIHDTIHYILDDHIHNDPKNASANIKMSSTAIYKIAQTVNMYITSGVGVAINKRASFYSRTGDYVVIRKDMMSPNASFVEAHELGHFFTLNHPFYGWEGVDAQSVYPGQNAPTSHYYSGATRYVEYVTRTGPNKNCSYAADGFCDTPADYYSVKTTSSCNFTPLTYDPSGATLNPDEANFMGYYSSCRDSFSMEQRGAILNDIISRGSNPGWVTQSPASTIQVSEVGITNITPSNGAIFQLSGNTTKLDWSPVAGATMYLVELYPVTSSGVFTIGGPMYSTIIRNVDEIDLPNNYLTDLFYNYQWTKFAWKVRPMNNYWTCSDFTPYYHFELGTPTGTQDLEVRRVMSMDVNPNPVLGNNTTVVVQSTEEIEGAIQLYSIQGQLLAEQPSQLLAVGENRIEINLTNVNAGTYMVVVQTERGALHKKLIIQR